MKKLLLGLGTLASIAAPVAAVVACGSDSTNIEYKDATTAQVTALGDLSTALDNLLTGPVKAQTPKIQIAGDKAQYTYGTKPAVADEATTDASDDTDIVFAEITVNLSNGKVESFDVTDGTGTTTSSLASVDAQADAIKTAATKAKVELDKINEAAKVAAASADLLAKSKTTYIATVNGSKLTDTEKTAAIAKINGATSTSTLATIMTGITTDINAAENKAPAAQTPKPGTGVADLAAKITQANADIADAIAGIPDTAFADAVKAKAPMWDEVTKESEMARTIKIVTTGYKVVVENAAGVQSVRYFVADDASIQTQLDDAHKNEDAYEATKTNHGNNTSEELKIISKDEIKTPMIIYTDAVSNGFADAWTPAEFAARKTLLKMDATVLSDIKAIVATALTA